MCKRSLVKSPHGIQIHLDLIFFFNSDTSILNHLLSNKLGGRRLFKNHPFIMTESRQF